MTIESAIADFGFIGGEGHNPFFSLFVDGGVRAKWSSDGSELYRKNLRYLSDPKPLSVWTRDNALLLKQELETALTRLAERSMEDMYLVHDLYRGERRCFALAGADSPTLVWEAFPGSQDRAADPEEAGRISNVTYDLRICRGNSWDLPRANVIYDERDSNEIMVHDVMATERSRKVRVTENVMDPIGHVVDTVTSIKTLLVAEPAQEIQLAPKTDYFCSIRAKFKLDNQTRQTSWSPYFAFTSPDILLAEPVYTQPVQVVGKTFYTRVNMWYKMTGQIYSTNYHEGAILPVGTKVKIMEAADSNPSDRHIRFEDGAGRSYTLIFQLRHAKHGMTLWHLIDLYFGDSDPVAESGAFRALSTEEQSNARLGKIDNGMSKPAVIMAFGYPPSHKTPYLQDDTWIYWENGKDTITVRFKDDRVISINRH